MKLTSLLNRGAAGLLATGLGALCLPVLAQTAAPEAAAAAVAAAPDVLSHVFELQYAMDTFYFLVCGALVMWMAAGFS
ncbi:MAG: hypothetical protein ACO3CJ_04145, partial [Burkholderiaceae bacterium]